MPLSSCCKYGPMRTFLLTSPIGELTLTCCPRAIHSLQRRPNSKDMEEMFVPKLSTAVIVKNNDHSDDDDDDVKYKSAEQCVDWLRRYFSRGQSSSLLPTSLPSICHLIREREDQGESFSVRIWRALQSVPAGHTVSYGQLAILAGLTKRHSRAVGHAMQSNPVVLLVPCHRVIKSSGGIGNYSAGGTTVKQWLLNHEASSD